MEQRVTRLGACVLLWYSFCGSGISCRIKGLPVFSRNTHPTLSHGPWTGPLPPARHRKSCDPVQARWLDRDAEVGDDRHTVREGSLVDGADVVRGSGVLG